jgi:arabinogalactan endo-1,4-beta-galactosidase
VDKYSVSGIKAGASIPLQDIMGIYNDKNLVLCNKISLKNGSDIMIRHIGIVKQLKGFFFIRHLPVSILSLLFLFPPQEVHSQFANGADIGWLSQMEAQGYVFNNDSGVQENCLAILKEHGMNALRFRVWVNPAGGWCGKKNVVYMAHRADSLGFSVMIDFHCSDTWADPSHQAKPSAWRNDTFSQLLTDLYNHIYGVLDTLKSIGVVPKWVQIGNETNDGMLWEDGRASTHMSNFAAMIKSGYDAVKAVDTTIQVIVHLSNGHDNAMFRWMFDGLKSNGARWDIIGMSVYPYWANMPWSNDDSLALLNMKDMIARYQTKVMVCETGYLYNQAIAANQFLLDLIVKTKSVGGLGVFYWEPECYSWQNYQLGAWDPGTKRPTVALDAFLGKNAASVKQEKNNLNFDLNIYPNPFNPSTQIHYAVPATSKVLLSVYNLLGQKMRTLVDDVKSTGEYSVLWSGENDGGGKAASGIYLVCFAADQVWKTKKIVLMR